MSDLHPTTDAPGDPLGLGPQDSDTPLATPPSGAKPPAAAFEESLRTTLAKGRKLLPLGGGCYLAYRGSRKAVLKGLAQAQVAARRRAAGGNIDAEK